MENVDTSYLQIFSEWLEKPYIHKKTTSKVPFTRDRINLEPVPDCKGGQVGTL